MKLIGAQVRNYKSIDDSGWVPIDNVTCLVGKNESGKTAFLQALEKLSPVSGGNKDFDPVMDYPRKGWAKYKRSHNTTPAIVVTAEFELSPEEVQEIEAAFGKNALKSPRVKASKDYENTPSWKVEIDETAVIRHLLNDASLPPTISEEAEKMPSIEALISLLEGLADRPPSADNLLSVLVADFETSVLSQVIEKYLNKFVPQFVYFNDYSVMRGRISIGVTQLP